MANSKYATSGTLNPVSSGEITYDDVSIDVNNGKYIVDVCKVTSNTIYDKATCSYSFDKEVNNAIEVVDRTNLFSKAYASYGGAEVATVQSIRATINHDYNKGDVDYDNESEHFSYNGGIGLTYDKSDIIQVKDDKGNVTGFSYSDDSKDLNNTSNTLSKAMSSYTRTSNPMYARNMQGD